MEKTIEEIKNENFEIPEYQRGYRWETSQVENLLNDMNEYFTRNEKEENTSRCYYLQPIIIKRDVSKQNTYILIDGQQRLTTIYMILTYINRKKLNHTEQELYTIEYQTIKDSENSEKSMNLKDKINEYIDDVEREEKKIFHSLNEYYYNFAIKTIHEWFKHKEEKIRNLRDFIKNNVKILWYELDDEDKDNENETFIRINTNKIKLTQADLVKAEFLRKDKGRKMKEISPEQIGKEWDEIEKNLSNPKFWFFISDKITEDKMSELLNITIKVYYSDRMNKQKSYDENEIYNIFEKEINKKEEDGLKTTWDNIKETFYILNEWYEDIELYNLIGYIIMAKKNSQSFNWIVSAINGYRSSTSKKAFKQNFLIKEIKEKLFARERRGQSNQLNEKDVRENLENINYDDNKDEIKDILILYNILTLNTLQENEIRFAFDKYKNSYDERGKKIEWDIEHIHSQHEKKLEDLDDKKEYIYYLKIYWINRALKEGKNVEEIVNKINELENDIKNKEIKKMAKDRGLEIVTDVNLDQIGNLALLDSRTNRGYGDSLFIKKRAEIIKKDEEKFIPICTKKAFLKAFVEKEEKRETENMMQFFEWNSEDADIYTQDIANKLYEGIYKEEDI